MTDLMALLCRELADRQADYARPGEPVDHQAAALVATNALAAGGVLLIPRADAKRILVGPNEIARRSHVESTAIANWWKRHPELAPEPLVKLAAGPVFMWDEVQEFQQLTGLPGRPRRRAA